MSGFCIIFAVYKKFKNMLVLFEGPDQSGKTTFIKKIKSKFLPEALVCKRDSLKLYDPKTSNYPVNVDLNNSSLYDWRFFVEMHQHNFTTHNFLCDRSFLSQKIYQDALHPETKTELLDQILIGIEKEISKHPHLLVYCRNNSLDNEDSDIFHMDHAESAVVKRYDDYIKNECILNKIVIDTGRLDPDSSVSLIIGAIQAGYNHHIQNIKTPLNLWAN